MRKAQSMLKLGEYCENDAKSIVKYLKDAGMKVELKTSIDSTLDTDYYLQAKQSKLKETAVELDEYEHYLNIGRSLLARGVKPEEFEDQFLLEIDPSINEKRSRLASVLAGSERKSKDDSIEDPEEENRGDFISLVQDISKAGQALEFIEDIFERNNIKFGEAVGGRIEDPIMRVPVSSKDVSPEHELCKTTLSVHFEKLYEVYVDEFSTALDDEIEDEFRESFPDEYLMIMAMGMMIADLVEEPGKGKMQPEDFAERCALEFDNHGNTMKIEGRDVAEDIAKVLEKNGVIKIKGDTIKWKA